jgi:hypothetical protein
VVVAFTAVAVASAPVNVAAHGPDKALVGSCTVTNTSGIVKMDAEVVNATEEVLKNIRPGEMLASGTGNASILFQAFPRAVRDLLPAKTARLTWKGRVFGDGYLDLSTEVIGDSPSGQVSSGIINCNRIAVGNPGSEEPPTPTPRGPGEPTLRPSDTERPTSTVRPTNTLRPTSTRPPDTPTRTVRPTNTTRPTRTRVPTSTQRPTRTPIPTFMQRPTRTPIGVGPTQNVPRATRTRRPTATRRPTRTPLVAAATRTPVPERPTRTRIPTATQRPTRTPLLSRATVTQRPTRTPIGFGQPTATPTHGSGGGTPGPNYNPNGLTAQCSLRRTIDLVTITMLVQNNTGADIRGLAGSPLDLAPEGGALFFDRTGPNPDTYSLVRNGFSVSFQWSGRLTPGGTMGFAAFAAGSGPDNREVRTALTNCGSTTSENGPVDVTQFTGRCGIDAGDSGRINVTVSNHSGASLTDVVAHLRSRNVTGGVQVLDLSGPVPGSSRRLPNGQSATYAWRARILGTGQLTVQFEATALRSNGQQASTGLFECEARLSGGGGNLPDLGVDEEELRRSVRVTTENFGRGHCAFLEGCLGGTGSRRLLRFSTRTPNFGPGDVLVGDPAGNPNFVFSECHAHFHFEEYADYRLLDLNGNLVARGHKQAFCLIDLDRVAGVAGRGGPQFPDCGYQGISAGWADVYHSNLDCQWVDITGVPEGRYILEVSVNPARVIEEGNFTNNSARTEVFIPRQ